MNDDISGIIWLFGIIGAAGVCCLFIAAYQIWRGASSKNWRETRGVIRANKSSSFEDVPGFARGGLIGNTPSYAFSVRYDYVVDDRSYTGKRIYYGMRNMNQKAELLALLSEFHVGNEVAVFVDPNAPKRSVLIPGVSSASVGLFSLGLVITIIGGVIWYLINQ